MGGGNRGEHDDDDTHVSVLGQFSSQFRVELLIGGGAASHRFRNIFGWNSRLWNCFAHDPCGTQSWAGGPVSARLDVNSLEKELELVYINHMAAVSKLIKQEQKTREKRYARVICPVEQQT